VYVASDPTLRRTTIQEERVDPHTVLPVFY
jgi:hypothetical protein